LSPAKIRKYVVHWLSFVLDQFISFYSGEGGREVLETFYGAEVVKVWAPLVYRHK
jgi:hypothetical protein